MAHRADHDNTNVPPPLISYKRFNLDLNTISCSPSQPHYIALGGAHLHCFLHDRRMLGRDIEEEQGKPGRASPANSMSDQENELMGQATRCVRKFAPEGRKKMRRTDNGHITACKISDANPNEMIASWSGDHIYSFDLVKSPDATERRVNNEGTSTTGRGQGKVKESRDRKRKRKKGNSQTTLEGGRKTPRPTHLTEQSDEEGELALRVRYENGQSEDISMRDAAPNLPPVMLEEAREAVLNESQKRGLRISKSIIKIRKYIFSLEASGRDSSESLSLDPSHHAPSFTAALGLAATCLPEMDEISRSWRYPVNPLGEDVLLQRTLRRNRDLSRRFVQASGTLARLLGGRLQTAGRSQSHTLELFREVKSTVHEGPHPSERENFSYDFLKAIILWLEGGQEALLQGFMKDSDKRTHTSRFPIPEDASIAAIDEYLIPYLLRLAKANAVANIDASRFEKDETRKIFDSETAAVVAFGNAVRMPLADLSRAIMPASGSGGDRPIPIAQDRKTALKYWGFKVGRAVLLNAGEGVDYQFVDTAFGGLGSSSVEADRVQDDIDPDEKEEVIDKVTLMKRSAGATRNDESTSSASTPVASHAAVRDQTTTGPTSTSVQTSGSDIDIEEAGSDAEVILMDDIHNEIAEHMAEEYEDSDNDNDNDAGDVDDDDDDDDDDDGDITAEERQFIIQSASNRGKLRENVEKDVPCYSHTRQYRGHCNVKTVKDANFFGLQDEYVVSGSDGGHVFIWYVESVISLIFNLKY